MSCILLALMIAEQDQPLSIEADAAQLCTGERDDTANWGRLAVSLD
jgi:hypothetical protein